MPDTLETKGKCLCGAVEITARALSTSVAACHCNMCRRWGGGPLLAVDCGDAVSFIGEDAITVFNSSDWAERGFCNRCGTHLFYRLKQTRQHFLPAGLFPVETKYALDMQLYIDEKPDYYCFANDTKTMTADEVVAMFGDGTGEN